MKLRTVIPFALVAAACVPTEAEKFPRGGVSVTLAPSEATAGRPFQSNDGWTVTLEKTALRVSASASPRSLTLDYGYGGTQSLPRILDPRYLCEIRVSGLAPGQASVTVQLSTIDPRWQIEDDDQSEPCAVDEATLRRFKTFSDDTHVAPDMLEYDPNVAYASAYAPSVYVKGFATKDGRTVSFDLALGVTTTPASFGEYDENGVWRPLPSSEDNVVEIVPNQGAPAKFEVHFESMFAAGIRPLAEADTNQDGVVTPAELRAVTLACASTNPPADGGDDGPYRPYDPPYPSPYPGPPKCDTLMEQLVLQASTILGQAPAKR